MALVSGDIHGHYAKAKAFLEYKPEEEHIFTGDLLDSFKATDGEINQTFYLIFNQTHTKKIQVLWGNHELHYLTKRPFTCSGFRQQQQQNYNSLVEEFKHHFKAAIYKDGFIITHAGVHPILNKKIKEPEEMAEWINQEMDAFIKENKRSPIFNIGGCRGGFQQFGGVFWLDWNQEKFNKNFNQIVGHTHRRTCQEKLNTRYKTHHILVDVDEFVCYNTATKTIEDFMPENCKEYRNTLEVLF